MQEIQKKGPVPLRKLNAKVPPDLETIIQKATRANRRAGMPSARALADDLGRFLEGRTIMARRSSIPDRIGAMVPPKSVDRSEHGHAAGRHRRQHLAGRSRTTAERAARNAEESSRAERNRAESQAQMFAAVNEFLNKDLLAQASPDNQARPGRKPDPDLKVRTALDRASEKIGLRFAEQPVVEAVDPADDRRDVLPARALSAGACCMPSGRSELRLRDARRIRPRNSENQAPRWDGASLGRQALRSRAAPGPGDE